MLEETIIFLVLALLIFGPKKLPEIAREIGKIVGEYRRIVKEMETEIELKELELKNIKEKKKK